MRLIAALRKVAGRGDFSAPTYRLGRGYNKKHIITSSKSLFPIVPLSCPDLQSNLRILAAETKFLLEAENVTQKSGRWNPQMLLMRMVL